MSQENTSTPYLRPLILLATLLVFVCVGGGMSLVWLRTEIAASAERTRTIESELARIERLDRALAAKIAAVHAPAYLIERSRQMGLPLQPPNPGQIVRLAPATPHQARPAHSAAATTRFASYRPAGSTPPHSAARKADQNSLTEQAPILTTFDLALLEGPLKPTSP